MQIGRRQRIVIVGCADSDDGNDVHREGSRKCELSTRSAPNGRLRPARPDRRIPSTSG